MVKQTGSAQADTHMSTSTRWSVEGLIVELVHPAQTPDYRRTHFATQFTEIMAVADEVCDVYVYCTWWVYCEPCTHPAVMILLLLLFRHAHASLNIDQELKWSSFAWIERLGSNRKWHSGVPIVGLGSDRKWRLLALFGWCNFIGWLI